MSNPVPPMPTFSDAKPNDYEELKSRVQLNVEATFQLDDMPDAPLDKEYRQEVIGVEVEGITAYVGTSSVDTAGVRGAYEWPQPLVDAYYELTQNCTEFGKPTAFKTIAGWTTYMDAATQLDQVRYQAKREFGLQVNGKVVRFKKSFAIAFRLQVR